MTVLRRTRYCLLAVFFALVASGCLHAPSCATIVQQTSESVGSVQGRPLYPVDITLAEGVTSPQLVSVDQRIALGWPDTQEDSIAMALPAGEYRVAGTLDGRGCSCQFVVES